MFVVACSILMFQVLVAELAAEKDSQEWKDKGQIKDSAEELFIAFKVCANTPDTSFPHVAWLIIP